MQRLFKKTSQNQGRRLIEDLGYAGQMRFGFTGFTGQIKYLSQNTVSVIRPQCQ